jgi:hypothetical protein
LWQPFWKWRPIEIFQCRESIRNIIIYPHIKFWWYRTILNFCGIVAAILKMATCRNFQCRQSIRDIIIYPHIKFWWYRTMLNFCGIVAAILKIVTGRNCSMSGINSGHRYLPIYINFNDIGQCWIFTPHFLCRVLAAILKMADISKILKRRIAPLMLTYHYFKFYVSIIIHLEVININVRNFNFSIGFYSNPFEPLKIWLWPPLPQSWKL